MKYKLILMGKFKKSLKLAKKSIRVLESATYNQLVTHISS